MLAAVGQMCCIQLEFMIIRNVLKLKLPNTTEDLMHGPEQMLFSYQQTSQNLPDVEFIFDKIMGIASDTNDTNHLQTLITHISYTTS